MGDEGQPVPSRIWLIEMSGSEVDDSMAPQSAAARIEQFLSQHSGDLYVAVGYASPAGLAWLSDRTAGRRVSVLIGNTRPRYWNPDQANSQDVAKAVEFIRRTDVSMRAWYRTSKSGQGQSAAHLKAWVVEEDGVPAAALVGSANLTNAGLHENMELMVEAAPSDVRQAWQAVSWLHGKGWDREDALLGYLAPPRPEPSTRPVPSRRKQSVPSGKSGDWYLSESSGCLPSWPRILLVLAPATRRRRSVER